MLHENCYTNNKQQTTHHQTTTMPPGDGLPRPLPSNLNPMHPIPGDPLKCPLSTCKGLKWPSNYTRDLHYLQDHMLKVPTKRRSSFEKDSGNYDGIIGKKKHILEPERLRLEPESYIGERVPREDYGKLTKVKKENCVDRLRRKLGKKN
jgi:hypothetical protein